jgi:hypothetical protein
VDLKALTDGAGEAAIGVDHGETLVAFAEGVVGDDDEVLARARAEVLERLGAAGLVDAAAVASNFQRMVRIANSTGIPLDSPVDVMTADLRTELGLTRFASAADTPAAGPAKRAVGRVLRPLTQLGLNLFVGARRLRRS